uniref:PH01B001G05.23 protein n=1 Tax=Phyllostachys edulis TaxID=38705 RepID=L0P1Z0_PHYED|nr:PH01B001G05.23 [Phyllostachys edulis]
MAATLHAKINRKRLDKLDIIKICEEILNPSVPMALRLSGILMGGVVIVYERKFFCRLKSCDLFLADDVSRLRTEINEAWRMKPATDPTVLPKGKAQAKYEAVTLPENVMDMEVEQPMLFSEADTANFRGMRLEDLDEQYVNVNLDDDDLSRAEHHHQGFSFSLYEALISAEAVNITLVDNFESGLAETDVFNRFERLQVHWFPHHLGRKTLLNNKSSIMLPHPLFKKNLNKCKYLVAITDNCSAGGSFQKQEEQKMKGQPAKPSKRKARGKVPQMIMDNNQIMIPGNIYQTWLKDPSSLVSKRHKVSSNVKLIRAIKISDLMDLPPVALISNLDKSPSELYYPKQLMQLWKECTEPQGEHPSEMEAHPLDFADDIEKLRGNISAEYERAYDTLLSDHSVTPGSPGLSHRSASSSGGSGRGFTPLEPEIQLQSGSGRSKRRQHSSGRSLGNLDPVEEDFPLEQEVRDFKMRRLSDIGPTPGQFQTVIYKHSNFVSDLLEETEPTQTPYEKQSNPIDMVTESIHSYLKLHFGTPGAPQSESLSQLAYGMTTAKAARLFYQACVLATFDRIKVTQLEPYGDILISRGPKM